MHWGPLTNDLVRESPEPLLVDYHGPTDVVAICFAAYNHEVSPPFEFYGRLKKLEAARGVPINKILVRDLSNSWYHYGIPGVAESIDATLVRLKRLLDELNPVKVVALGLSMGGFGAILYGALLDVHRVVAFGPLARFSSDAARVYSDDRWSDVVKRVESAPPPKFYQDLPATLQSLPIRTDVRVLYGTKPTSDPADKMKFVEAVNYDAIQGLLYHGSSKVRATPIRWAGHRVVDYLRSAGFIDEFIANVVLDVPFLVDEFADVDFDREWLDWMTLNYSAGFDESALIPQCDRFPTSAGSPEQIFGRVRRNVLRRLLQTEQARSR